MTIVLLALLAAVATLEAEILREADVVDSVRRNHPVLLGALAGRDIADAQYLEAQGKFDTTIRSSFNADTFGYYENRRADASLEQPLAFQGMSVYGGYRVGEGTFAPYDGKLDTRSYGEWRSGLKLPLMRNREIDSRRAGLEQARLGRTIAGLSADQQRLVLLQAAIARYWYWVAAGRRLAVTRAVLDIARMRQQLLEEGVREGQLPAIDAIDNRRAILQRQASLIEAERGFQQAAIDLSLYLRDANGRTRLAVFDEVPPAFPAATDLPGNALDTGIDEAIARRPELARLRTLIDQTEVDLSLARNAAKPAVDLVAGFTAENGTGTVRRGPREFKAGLAFEFPFQNRAARGKQGASEAKIRQLTRQQDYLRDQVQAEVRDALSAVEAARARVDVLENEVRVSRELEDAERTRFELGEGTLFILNLREQATLDASIRRALAQAEFQRAHAGYEYATGRLLGR
ncbi:MAG: TolC family protein [Bryobacteraceae bacterium]